MKTSKYQYQRDHLVGRLTTTILPLIWTDPPEHVEDAGKIVRVSGDFRHHDSCRDKSQKKTKSYIILIPWSVLSTSKKTILVQILDFHDSLHPRHHMYIQGKVSRVNKTLLECFFIEFPTLSFCSHVNELPKLAKKHPRKSIEVMPLATRVLWSEPSGGWLLI